MPKNKKLKLLIIEARFYDDLADALLDGAKGYTVTMRLGVRTDTGDSTGSVIEQAPVPALDAARLEQALSALRGPQQQVPPMYSALKQGGQPLYRLARRGLTVERAPRAIEIYELEALEFGGDPRADRLAAE